MFDELAQMASMMMGGYGGGMDMSSWYNGVVAQQNAQMNQMTANIVQQNMANPQVQQAYQQHLAQGGGYSFEQFAYMYAATGGFSQQGMAHYQQVEMGIQQQQQHAMQDYRQAQAQSAAAMQGWRDNYYANQAEAGNVMQGNQTYQTPFSGPQPLPYTWQPGYHTHNQQNYYVDANNQYYQQAPDGWYYPLPPQR